MPQTFATPGNETIRVSHLSKLDIGVPISLVDEDGNDVDLVATNPSVNVAIVAEGSSAEIAQAALGGAVWHTRADSKGVLRAFADISAGPGGAVPWPVSGGACEMWWQVITMTQTPLERAPGRIVLY